VFGNSKPSIWSGLRETGFQVSPVHAIAPWRFRAPQRDIVVSAAGLKPQAARDCARYLRMKGGLSGEEKLRRKSV
jgi:hypothetical protein